MRNSLSSSWLLEDSYRCLNIVNKFVRKAKMDISNPFYLSLTIGDPEIKQLRFKCAKRFAKQNVFFKVCLKCKRICNLGNAKPTITFFLKACVENDSSRNLLLFSSYFQIFYLYFFSTIYLFMLVFVNLLFLRRNKLH